MKSSAMLKSKSFKLEKPKKGEGWAKFVEWNRQWNKILSVIFGILSFSLLFAIVLANILHTDYKNYEIATTTTTTTTEEPLITTLEPTTTSTTEDPTTTEVYTEETPTSTSLQEKSTEPTTDVFTSTTPMTPPYTPTPALSETTTTTRTTFSASPPVVTTVRSTPPLGTTISDTTEFTSAAVQPGSTCNTIQCTLAYCTLTLLTCSITCADGYGTEDVTSSILVLLTKVVCDKSIDLVLADCEFKGNTLKENWLDIKTKVLSLEIDATLEKIERGAFSANIFSGTHTITFHNSQITKLDSVFEGLSSLATLSFYGAQFQEITADAFDDLLNLHTLNLENNAHLIRLENITGSSTYSNLLSVSLRYNQIRSIPSASFVGVPRLQTIYLHSSLIDYIDSDAFNGAGPDLSNVYLNDNILSLVEAGAFSQALQRTSLYIYLEGNPIHCICYPGLKELQMLMNNGYTSNNFQGEVLCASPAEVAGTPVRDVDLACVPPVIPVERSTPYVSTTLETSVNTPVHLTTTDSTTHPNSDNPEESVEDDSSSSSFSLPTRPPPRPPVLECPSDGDGVFTAELTISFENGHRFNLTEMEEGAVLVKIHPKCEDYVYLLWFMNTFLEFEPSLPFERSLACRSGLDSQVLVENLTTDSIYTFCMVSVLSPYITPFDCLSIYLQPTKLDRPWLKNRDRLMAYVVVSVMILIVFALGIIVSCLCIRKSRRTLGKKLRTTTTSQDMMIMPPLPKRNTRMMLHKGAKPLQRSVSDTSLASGRSYVSAINPSPFEIITWKMDRNRPALPAFYNLEKMPDGQAPIPPPKRPSDTSHYSNVEEIYERSIFGVEGNHYVNYHV